MVNGSWTPNKTELLFPGIMTDLVLVDCYLPESPVVHSSFDDVVEGTPAAGLMISVSNDGEHRSKENLTFISYDSGCMSCGVSSGCFLKVSKLFILASFKPPFPCPKNNVYMKKCSFIADILWLNITTEKAVHNVLPNLCVRNSIIYKNYIDIYLIIFLISVIQKKKSG